LTGVKGVSKKPIIKALKDFGLTEKEAEAYILLAKHGVLKGGEITRQMKRNKGQVYRILHSLQQKGLVETTLESPKRFIAIPFEKALEKFVTTKREELTKIEEKTKDLLSDWERISQTTVEQPLEKFSVIEGNKKIYQKIAEMIEKTQSSLSAISTVADLVRAEQYGVFDSAYEHPMRSEIDFRVLIELTKQNLKAFKLLRSELKAGLKVKARNPDLGLALFPRMVIRDDEEILFFISPKKQSTKKQEVCIYTNCRSLVQAFTSIFEDLWRNSTDIENKIVEIESGKPTPRTVVIADEEKAKEKYNQTLRTAEEEIIVMTSVKGLVQLSEKALLFKDLAKRDVSVKIMAPITNENMKSAKLLMECCEVRHVGSGLEITVVDGKHLFHFKETSLDHEEVGDAFSFKDAFYTTDLAYVEKTKNGFAEVWSNAYNITESQVHPMLRSQVGSKGSVITARDITKLPERLLLAGRTHHIVSGIAGDIIITPPSYLKMPSIKISVFHVDEETNIGISLQHGISPTAGNRLSVALWLETPIGEAWVPVAVLLNASPKVVALEKAKWAGTLAGQNTIVVKPEELQVWKEGKMLFAGWTIPIPLLGGKYKLDPGCILFEAFGKEYHGAISHPLPSGYVMGMEYDGFQAFTTFIGPSWKYSGPGISGVVCKLIIVNAAPETS
jgi:sugar-specific transcriptional regulator TrmB